MSEAPATAGSAPLPASARPSLWLIFSITVSGITANSLISPGVPDILDGLDASRSLAGLLIGAATFPGIVLAPVIGLLADRYGRREVVVPCMVLFGVAGGLGTLAPSLWVLVGLRVLQGVGSAGLINLAVVIIGDNWSGTARAHIIGRNAAVLTGALSVFPILGGVLTDVAGWRGPFAVYPLTLITAWLLYRRLPATPRREASIADLARKALPLLRTGKVLGVLGAGFVSFALIFGLLLTVLPIYAEQRFGLGASWRGVLLGIPALATFTASLNLGRLTRRLGRRRVLVGAAGLFAVALATVASAPVLALVVTGIIGFGLGEGMMIPSLQDLAAGAAPDESRGAVVAGFVSAARSGQTVGPVLAGAALGAFGGAATFGLGAGVSAALMVLLALFGGLLTREQ